MAFDTPYGLRINGIPIDLGAGTALLEPRISTNSIQANSIDVSVPRREACPPGSTKDTLTLSISAY